jgi:hypothetical protein
MKKDRRVVSFVLALSVIALLSSCGLFRTGASPSGSPASSASAASSETVPPVQPSVSAVPPSASATDDASAAPSTSPAAPFKFEDKTYKSGVFTISYPQITGLEDAKLRDELNGLIYDAATRDVSALKGDQALREYKLSGLATYNDPRLISVYFIGYKNLQDTMYSPQFLYTQNIDVGSRQTVQLRELVKISKSFVQLMLNGAFSAMSYDMTDEQATAIKLYLNETSSDHWITQLKNADSPDSFTSTYLTKDALVISVAVPHAMGDHIEITLPFKDLEKYKTTSPLWDVLQGTAVS